MLIAAFKQAAFGRRWEKSDPEQFELALEDLETAMAVSSFFAIAARLSWPLRKPMCFIAIMIRTRFDGKITDFGNTRSAKKASGERGLSTHVLVTRMKKFRHFQRVC